MEIPEDLVDMFESSKLDTTMFFGSDIRILIMRIAKTEQDLSIVTERKNNLVEALTSIRSGVLLMIPEPQKSGFMEIINKTKILISSPES